METEKKRRGVGGEREAKCKNREISKGSSNHKDIKRGKEDKLTITKQEKSSKYKEMGQ